MMPRLQTRAGKKLRFEERFQVFKALVYKEDWIQNYN